MYIVGTGAVVRGQLFPLKGVLLADTFVLEIFPNINIWHLVSLMTSAAVGLLFSH